MNLMPVFLTKALKGTQTDSYFQMYMKIGVHLAGGGSRPNRPVKIKIKSRWQKTVNRV